MGSFVKLRRRQRAEAAKQDSLDLRRLVGIVLASFVFYGLALSLASRPRKKHGLRTKAPGGVPGPADEPPAAAALTNATAKTAAKTAAKKAKTAAKSPPTTRTTTTTVTARTTTSATTSATTVQYVRSSVRRTPPTTMRFQHNEAAIARLRAMHQNRQRRNGAAVEQQCDVAALENAEISRNVLQGKPKYTSCAVVGSSGKLLGTNLGQEIDHHAFVVRHNNAPTRGFETDVGAKTSMMIQSSSAIRALKDADDRGDFQCPRTYATFYTAANVTLKTWQKNRCANETKANFIDIRDYLNRESLSRVLRSPKGDLMAGPTAILVALRVCQNHPIDLYGFTVGNVSDYAAWPYHYYDDVTPAARDNFRSISMNLQRFIKFKVPGCIRVRV